MKRNSRHSREYLVLHMVIKHNVHCREVADYLDMREVDVNEALMKEAIRYFDEESVENRIQEGLETIEKTSVKFHVDFEVLKEKLGQRMITRLKLHRGDPNFISQREAELRFLFQRKTIGKMLSRDAANLPIISASCKWTKKPAE